MKQYDPALLKALAEASAWIVMLHSPDRTPAIERGLQRWLSASPVHRYAFEHTTETWSATRATVRRTARLDVSAAASQSDQPRRSTPIVLAIAASLIFAIVGIVLYMQSAGLNTAVGERRTVVLDDGSQVTLNTATQMFVDYDKHVRRVRLESGEALFEVARHPERPFIVVAGNRRITALGTSFLVRRDSAAVAVTLVEGKVAVSEASPVASGDLTLSPGERVVFAERAEAVVDRPKLEKLTAWQQGLVNIDDLTLVQAVAEMNRYSSVQLAVEGPAAELHVSGVFRVTDSENLAKAVALTHGLQMRRVGRRIILSGTPQPPGESRFGPTSQQNAGTP